jgi:retron-type reverse transcriptase
VDVNRRIIQNYPYGRGSSASELTTLNEVIAGGKVSWVLEADLKNFFGSVSHEWVLHFVEHRVGDPRIACLVPAPPA